MGYGMMITGCHNIDKTEELRKYRCRRRKKKEEDEERRT